MNTNDILKADVLDIIFDKRNKLYGAYPLRKYYPERVKTALAIMFAVVSLFAVYAIIPSSKTIVDVLTITDGPELISVKPPVRQDIKQEVKPPSKKSDTKRFTANFVPVKDDEVKEKISDITKFNIGSTTTISVTDGLPVDGPDDKGNGSGPVDAATEKEETTFNPEVIVESPDVKPEFPGGINALRAFLERNLTNPEELANGEEVKVKVKFVVGYDGLLKGFEIIEDGGTVFNNEVIRVLKKMPHWIPGKSNGRNVSVYSIIPIKFISNE